MEKSSQIAWKIVPLRHFFPLKVVPLIEVLLYINLHHSRDSKSQHWILFHSLEAKISLEIESRQALTYINLHYSQSFDTESHPWTECLSLKTRFTAVTLSHSRP
jgi:hypothetical protein